MNVEEAYKLGVEEAGDSFTTSFDVHTEEGAKLMEAYENGRNDGEKALEDEEVLTHWEKICEANPQGYDEDNARVYYDNQQSYWDTVDAEEFWDEFQENYQGRWDNDEEFAYDMADSIGAINKDATWPNSCIDWKKAARELMYDYWSDKGVYFRS